MTETILEEVSGETNSFILRKQDHVMIIEAKTPKNLTKRQRREFNANKATVELQLFDDEFVNRMNSLPYDEPDTFQNNSIIKTAFSRLFDALTVK